MEKWTYRTNVVTLCIALVSLSPPCKGQKARLEEPIIIPPSIRRPALPGRADGELKQFATNGKTVRTAVFKHPAPKVLLVFPATQTTTEKRVELPRAARKPLGQCWVAELEYYYKQAFESPNKQKQYENALRLGQANGWVLSELENIVIDAPDGKRKISAEEAASLVGFMAQSAREVIEQAKASRKQPPAAIAVGTHLFRPMTLNSLTSEPTRYRRWY